MINTISVTEKGVFLGKRIIVLNALSRSKTEKGTPGFLQKSPDKQRNTNALHVEPAQRIFYVYRQPIDLKGHMTACFIRRISVKRAADFRNK